MKKSIIAVIPARGGSKRLPRKNIKSLAGRPLIQWTIEAANECDLIDEVMVSTDDSEIAEAAIKCGAKVPFIRPDELSNDTSSSIDVVLHTLDYYQKLGVYFDYVMLLQPTSPLRQANHISESIELLYAKKADAIVSVCETEHSPLWANILDESGSMSSFLSDEIKNSRSQDLPDYFRLNGAIYLVDVQKLRKEKTFMISENIYALKMDRMSSVDIDEYIDFLFAESVIQGGAQDA